ncbi:MAG: branched-chain amino acid ABC transporter permease [Ilumatobacteraceae bacterium]|nr:branched-chain amino acid ABC transporter permease [Ilumatobacteraceae bacterium]
MVITGAGKRTYRIVRAFAVVAGSLVLFGSSANVASAEEGLLIIASVQNQTVDAGVSQKQPVAGVTITVTTPAGAMIGTGVTDVAGLISFPIPARDNYVVTLDIATLPNGFTMIDAAKSISIVNKDDFTTTVKRATFFTGSSNTSAQTLLNRMIQRGADGLRLGLVIAMCAVGLSLIFGTTGLTNFAHGEMVTFGGLMAFLMNVTMGIPLLISAPIVVALGGLFGLALNIFIFGKLRRRGVGLISQLVVSVGLSIVLRNMYLYQFGGRTKPLNDYSAQTVMRLGPTSITPRDLTTAVLSLLVLVAVALFIQKSRTGKAIRAVSDNPTLASSTGIDTQRIIRIVWFAGGALAALGGIFRGLDEQVGFEMGSRLVFLMFAAITLGGLGSAFGALVGGVLVGILVEMASLVVPAELKNAPALLILIIVLVLRPQGILGRKQRVG